MSRPGRSSVRRLARKSRCRYADRRRDQLGAGFERLRNLGCHVSFLPPAAAMRRPCITSSASSIAPSSPCATVGEGPQQRREHHDCHQRDRLRAQVPRHLRKAPQPHRARRPVVADADAVRRRRNMIRNLILLGEQDDYASHLRRLRPVAEVLQRSGVGSPGIKLYPYPCPVKVELEIDKMRELFCHFGVI